MQNLLLSFSGIGKFLQWLETKLDLKGVIRLLHTFDFKSADILNTFESVKYERELVKVLKDKHVICSDDIGKLMSTLNQHERFEEAKAVRASFEGYTRESAENGKY